MLLAERLFPDLLEEDMHGNLALRESLSTEGEVLRTAEMRAAARAALLRQDTLDKLKRALKSWPRGEQKEYSPGETVYFYSPKPKTARFRRDAGLGGSGSNFDEGIASAILFVMAWQVSLGFCTPYSPCLSARG